MPAYKDQRSGRWRYRKRITMPDGRRVRIEGTPPTDTKKSAEHAEQMHVLRMTNPSMVPTSAPIVVVGEVPTLAQYAKTFLEFYGVDHKPSAQRSKRQILNSHLLPFFGQMRLDAIRQVDIDAFKTAQLAHLAPKTVRNRLGVLSTFLNYTAGNLNFELRALNFNVKGASEKIAAVSAADVAKLVAVADDRYALAILLAAEAGLRIGEIRGLQWGDVKNGQIHVRQAFDTRGNVGTPKHDKERTIPTSTALATAFSSAPRRGLWVVPRLDGAALGYWAMLEAIHDVYDDAKVEPTSMPWHALRHTFGTQLVASGVPLSVVATMMGHESVKTTERYITVVDSQRRDAIDRAFR